LGAELRRPASVPSELGPPPFAFDQWHVAINHVPVGPIKKDELSRKIGLGAVGPDSLVWREGFDDWRPLRLVPELIPLLKHRRPTQPALRSTTGFGPPGLGAPSLQAGMAMAPPGLPPMGGRFGAAPAPSMDLVPPPPPTESLAPAHMG